MTPKEKAWELIRLYRNIDFDNGEKCKLFISTKDAKRCALIAVDEILKLNNPNTYNYLTESKENLIVELADNYWQNVKQEIEKL